jgi:hypothetical protein
MTAPMRVIKAFVGPLVDAAMKRRGMDGGVNGRVKDGSLLDHLVNVVDGMCGLRFRFGCSQ